MTVSPLPTVRQVKRLYNPGLELEGVLFTMYDGRTNLTQQVAAEVAAQQEMETALRWASVDNRPLYNRYRHTKKKRIRKKYAKRILEWYRTEVAPC